MSELSPKEVLHGMEQGEILDMIQLHLSRIAKLQGHIALASEVLIESYGIDIDAVLEGQNTNERT